LVLCTVAAIEGYDVVIIIVPYAGTRYKSVLLVCLFPHTVAANLDIYAEVSAKAIARYVDKIR
jgi:hypothetical protein